MMFIRFILLCYSYLHKAGVIKRSTICTSKYCKYKFYLNAGLFTAWKQKNMARIAISTQNNRNILLHKPRDHLIDLAKTILKTRDRTVTRQSLEKLHHPSVTRRDSPDVYLETVISQWEARMAHFAPGPKYIAVVGCFQFAN